MSKKSEVTRKELAERHKDAIQRNYDRSEMLRAIAEAWDGHPECDYDYVRDVRRRQRQAENQLKAMRP